MGLLTKQQLRCICEKLPHVRCEKRLKDKQKRKEQNEFEMGLPKNSINIPLKKLAKLPASEIIKLIYSMKEQSQEFVLI